MEKLCTTKSHRTKSYERLCYNVACSMLHCSMVCPGLNTKSYKTVLQSYYNVACTSSFLYDVACYFKICSTEQKLHCSNQRYIVACYNVACSMLHCSMVCPGLYL